MFNKFVLASKEMNIYGILTIISGFTMTEMGPWLAYLPDSIETPVVAVITFLIGLVALALRTFWRGGQVVWKKDEATPIREVEIMKAKALIEKTKTPLEKARELVAAADKV